MARASTQGTYMYVFRYTRYTGNTLSDFKNATVCFYLVSEKLIKYKIIFHIIHGVAFIHKMPKNQKGIYQPVFEKKWFNNIFYKTSFNMYSLIYLIDYFSCLFRVVIDFWRKGHGMVFQIRLLQNCKCFLYEDVMCVSIKMVVINVLYLM